MLKLTRKQDKHAHAMMPRRTFLGMGRDRERATFRNLVLKRMALAAMTPWLIMVMHAKAARCIISCSLARTVTSAL